MLIAGDGVAKNEAEGARMVRAAADAGSVYGRYMVAVTLWQGQGVPQDQAAAVQMFRELADAGDAMAIAAMADEEVTAFIQGGAARARSGK